MKKQTCENCRFWEAPIDAEESGECRRRSPSWRDNESSYNSAWPETNRNEWCGEWEQNHEWSQDLPDLNLPISVLELSVRAQNCLDSENIQTLADLVRKTESEIARIRSMGKTTLNGIKDKLKERSLWLGMLPKEKPSVQIPNTREKS